jgi:hypothetical protein
VRTTVPRLEAHCALYDAAISVEAEFERDLVETADSSWAEHIVRAGSRALALRYHPDQGAILRRCPNSRRQRESPRRTSNAA